MPDRVSACEMKYLTNVEMKYLTNAARHRQTIQGGGCAVDKRARWLQRMLDNGVEVVVAVRKDGVPPWCRRICRLHHDLGYWDTGAGCCVGVHASKKPVAPQPLGVQVLQPCRMGPASGGTRALRARLRRRGPSPETRASTTRALPLVKAMVTPRAVDSSRCGASKLFPQNPPTRHQAPRLSITWT